MRPHFSERFIRSYTDAPPAIQRAFDRKLELLLQNLRHPTPRSRPKPAKKARRITTRAGSATRSKPRIRCAHT